MKDLPLQVRDVMSSPVVTVPAAAPLKDIVTTLLDAGVTAAPVVNESGGLVGIVTEADLLSRPAYGAGRGRPLRMLAEYFTGTDPQWLRKAEGLTAAEVMTRHVATIHPDRNLHVAARRMLEAGVKRLVVVDDDGRIAGIVARRDVLRAYAPTDDDVRAGVDRVLHSLRWVPDAIDVAFEVDAGIVRLHGSVLHGSDRAVVDHAVKSVPGVVDVVDRLVAREPEPSAS